MTREARQRMAEQFTASRDAEVAAKVGAGKWKSRNGNALPDYAKGDRERRPSGLKQLIRDLGQNVQRGREFD